VVRVRSRGVAAESRVLRDLRWRKQGLGCEVCSEMRASQLAVYFRQLLHARFEVRRSDGTRGERLIQGFFLDENCLARGTRCSVHALENFLKQSRLFRSELELGAQVENVPRSGVAVELGGSRQTHAAAVREIVDLLFAQATNRTVHLLGVRGVRTASVRDFFVRAAACAERCDRKNERAFFEALDESHACFSDLSFE